MRHEHTEHERAKGSSDASWEMLREDLLPDYGLTVSTFANALGVSRQTVNELLRERRSVSPEMAVTFKRSTQVFENGIAEARIGPFFLFHVEGSAPRIGRMRRAHDFRRTAATARGNHLAMERRYRSSDFMSSESVCIGVPSKAFLIQVLTMPANLPSS